MDIDQIIYRLSPSQLKALNSLSKSSGGIISSSSERKRIGKSGKALGGVFSALVRRKIKGQSLVLPWGKAADGKGLRWKLNEKLISKVKLLQVTEELLA